MSADLLSFLSESDLQTIKAGAMASLGYQAVQPHLDQQFGEVLQEAVSRFKARRLTAEEAYTAIGQLATILDVRARFADAIAAAEAVETRVALDAEHSSTVDA